MMKQNYGEIETEFLKIQDVIHYTNAQLNNIQHELQSKYINNVFHNVAFQASLALSYLERVQDSLLDVLTDTHHGKINSELISPGQLQDELLRIKGELPVDPESILKLYQIMTIKGRIVDKLAIFRITIPLILNEDLQLLGLHPIPWKNQQTKKINVLQLTVPYIIGNFHRDQFYPVSELELRSCQIIGDNMYLCHLIHPKYRAGSTTAACEMTLLTQKTYHPQYKVSTYNSNAYWKQLQDPNKWIYAIDQEVILNTVCNTNMMQLSCKGSGLLSLHENCIIRQPEITIQGRRTSHISNRMAYLPEVNISQAILPQLENFTIQYNNTYQAHHDELEGLKKKLNSISFVPTTSLTGHDIHHYTISWICLSLVLIMTIVLYRKYRSNTVAITSPAQHDHQDSIEMVTVWNTNQPPTTPN